VTAGAGDKITVTQSGNTITITGKNANKVASESFPLDNNAWYMISYEYQTSATIGNFIVELATPADIAADEAVGGLLPMLMETGKGTIIESKGTYKSTDYQLFADSCDGPWKVTIVKSPTPAPSGQTSFSHKVDDSYNSVTPYFHLNKGTATFTVNQQLKNSYSTPASVDLFNADTGAYVASITHNNNEATITDTEDIEADGNYIIHVACGGDWQISFTQ
jgi:hypothetical protein